MTSELKKLAREEFEKLRLPRYDSSYELIWYWWKKAFETAYDCYQAQQKEENKPISQ